MTEYPIVNALIFAVVAIAVFLAAFQIVLRVSPHQVWKAVAEEKNTAAAILAGAFALALATVIAAVMH